MKLIAAVDNNWGIGKNNNLLFPIPNDLKRFKKLTNNKIVIMGYNTLMSLPNSQPLKNRINIVLTSKKIKIDNATICNNLNELLNVIKLFNNDDIFVIGGSTIYNLLLDMCNEAYITKIYKTFHADKYIQNLDNKNWKIKEESQIYEYNDVKYNFVTYVKK